MSLLEVARLLTEIELSYRAIKRALRSFAEGVAKHEFIRNKMESIFAEYFVRCFLNIISRMRKDREGSMPILSSADWSK